MKEKLPIIIFDFDDLLVNSGLLHKIAFEETLSELECREPISESLYSEFYGLRILDISKRLKEHYGFKISPAEYAARRDVKFIELVRKELELMPGADKLLSLVRKNGYRRALASSGTREYLEAGLSVVKLDNFFEVVTSGDEVSHGKPAPDIFLKTAEKLEVDPNDCIVIEDAKHGVTAAHMAGMRCIGVLNCYSIIKQDLSEADVIVESLANINESYLK